MNFNALNSNSGLSIKKFRIVLMILHLHYFVNHCLSVVVEVKLIIVLFFKLIFVSRM